VRAASNTLQRAFELAQSGQFVTVEAIVDALHREGFRDGDAQTSGLYVRSQLHRELSKAQGAP